jgi:hypothetical protein
VSRLVLAVALVAAALGLAEPAGAAVFQDAAGDSGTAPDVRSLRVTNDARGQLRFRLEFANRPGGLEAGDLILLFLDADRDASTGDPGGDDYSLQFAQGAFGIARWDGVRHAFFASGSARVAASGAVITVTLVKGELGITRAFDLAVVAVRIVNGGIESGETAPDTGEWTYRLVTFCVVPDVRGRSLAAARRALRRANCAPGRISRRTARSPAGRVTGQSLRAGTTRPRGTRVHLVVSRGPKGR